ncbi:MAG TPA: PQQ-dependent sugar dehydrogenase [Candidatus Binatia bacterium]|jgi:hypothetical protein
MLVTLGDATSALADTAADRCAGAKEKAAGRYGLGLLQCQSAATRANTTVSIDCTSKASGKLTTSFGKAETAGGCVTSSDSGTIATAVGNDVQAIVSALAPDDNDAARQCAATKMKAAGKQYGGRLSCYSKGALQSSGPSIDCLGATSEKLTSVFSKADNHGGCTAVGDSDLIEGLGESGVRGEVATLSPVCGDGITGPTQQCEAADDAACPGLCSAACACVIPANCGNGTVEAPEQCDDNNNTNGDGCSATCQLENASAICAGIPTSSGTGVTAEFVASFSFPIHATAPPLDPSRLFVVEREGYIRIVNLADDSVRPTPFLDIHTMTTTDGERGLLSMAFDPDYRTNHRFYIDYTNNSGDTTIARYETSSGDPNVADPSTAKILIVITQPFSNHNGGQLAFGPDGYLYCGMGDGGSGGDPFGNGQSDTTLLGKMLRFDVHVDSPPYYAVPATNPHYTDGSDPLQLIWAKGTRNPWRFSFDRSTGDLVIGDVGQDTEEEIDFQPAGDAGGENYGWNLFEGNQCYSPPCPPPAGFTFPIYTYDHSGSSAAITGGFVYRGCAMPDLRGTYFFSDSEREFIDTIRIAGGAATAFQDRTSDLTSTGASFAAVVSFGEDARGEVYIVDAFTGVYRIVHH